MYNDEQMEEWIMATQYTEEFKKDAVRYWKEHPELGIGKCAKNLGISKSALSIWEKARNENHPICPEISCFYDKKCIFLIRHDCLRNRYSKWLIRTASIP